MKQPPKLVVAPFENRNGVTSYRITGWVNGERVRKNFKTRAEAGAEKTALEIGAIQAANGMQMVATTLTIDQVRDAEVCFRRLLGNTRPLSFYLEFGLTNYRPPEVLKKLGDAITDYTAAKKRELDQDQLSILVCVRPGSPYTAEFGSSKVGDGDYHDRSYRPGTHARRARPSALQRRAAAGVDCRI